MLDGGLPIAPVPFQECPARARAAPRPSTSRSSPTPSTRPPLECCGLLAGRRRATRRRASATCPAGNAAASARVYTVDPRDHLRADRDAEDAGLEIIGVVHSHTHTPAYPSPTDIAQAPDPAWHYAIVSLAAGRAGACGPAASWTAKVTEEAVRWSRSADGGRGTDPAMRRLDAD